MSMPAVSGAIDVMAARIAAVRAVIAEHAQRAGRDPAAVRIVAVTKTLPPDAVQAALDAGLTDVGENYVQEARAKREAAPVGATWHLIGGLQQNKAKAAVATFDRVHSVDSTRIAEALGREATSAGRRLPVLLQVNLAGRETQRGATPDDVPALARRVVGLPGLALDGLMTIAPTGGQEATIRGHFRALRALRDDVQKALGVELPHLSMGMSDDFSLAVEEGATLIRLGRALFGPRGPGNWREGA
jgi:pyridoxal phosphate enzyme (YggS family)